MALYELLVLGSPTPEQLNVLSDRASDVAKDLNLDMPNELAVRSGSDVAARNAKASSVALYFGGDPTADAVAVEQLEAANVPIIPVLSAGAKVTTSIPKELQPTNAYFLDAQDDGLEVLTTITLECLGLLREQRRVFISYRRTDSREVAVQLHDHLSASGV